MKNNEPHGVQPSEDTALYVLFSIPIADRIVNVCLAIFLIFQRGDVGIAPYNRLSTARCVIVRRGTRAPPYEILSVAGA